MCVCVGGRGVFVGSAKYFLHTFQCLTLQTLPSCLRLFSACIDSLFAANYLTVMDGQTILSAAKMQNFQSQCQKCFLA